ncbi:MAG: nitroreductase family protein [Spirochaetales bacterium]|jgi:nitroreductase|nr:nitroreductase family protein [Spirochaetales bacterium]
MNPIIQSLFDRKSVRVFQDKPVSQENVNLIIDAGIQAPSAGNQQLYTILHIQDQGIKDSLSVLCDNQPFIAKAPVVLVFLADCRRWLDCYRYAGTEARRPGPGDLILAIQDALIAAQNTVTAAESLGLGSCYIGDIMENREKLTALLSLDPLVFPATLVVYGYPSDSQVKRPKPPRPRRDFIVQTDRYSPLSEEALRTLHGELNPQPGYDFDGAITAFCLRKYASDFARELNRSAGEYLKEFI